MLRRELLCKVHSTVYILHLSRGILKRSGAGDLSKGDRWLLFYWSPATQRYPFPSEILVAKLEATLTPEGEPRDSKDVERIVKAQNASFG